MNAVKRSGIRSTSPSIRARGIDGARAPVDHPTCVALERLDDQARAPVAVARDGTPAGSHRADSVGAELGAARHVVAGPARVEAPDVRAEATVDPHDAGPPGGVVGAALVPFEGSVLVDPAAVAGADLAEGPTVALGLSKKLFHVASGPSLEDYLEYEAFVQPTLGMTHDHKEGVTAFKEKRKPKFKGR